METLPAEVSEHIFSLLNVSQIASAAEVCRTWNYLTGQAELWMSLFERRWGQEKASTVINNLSLSGSWKFAYEVQHRRDRIGTDWNIVCEGDGIYTTENGVLIQHLASCPKYNRNGRTSPSNCFDQDTVVQPSGLVESCQEICTTQTGERASSSGLLDKLLHFAAVLHSTRQGGVKRQRICK